MSDNKKNENKVMTLKDSTVPGVDELKNTFGSQKIPLAGDFASLIDMAAAGQAAFGAAADQDNKLGDGLISEDGNDSFEAGKKVKIKPDTNAGIAVNSDGVGINCGSGLHFLPSGALAVNTGDGLYFSDSEPHQLSIKEGTGIKVTDKGVNTVSLDDTLIWIRQNSHPDEFHYIGNFAEGTPTGGWDILLMFNEDTDDKDTGLYIPWWKLPDINNGK